MIPPIPVFISCDDNYAPHLCAVAASVLWNSRSEYRFMVLNSGLSEASRRNISLASKGRAEFVLVDRAAFDKFDTRLEHLTKEACFRYLIAEICPDIDKAVYLDCDVIVRADLRELFYTDISAVYAGVVEDFARKSYVEGLGLKKYFNSGVMLLNLKKFREDGIVGKLFDKSRELSGRSKFLDQDALNIVLSEKLKWLPLKWNATAPIFRKIPMSSASADEVREAVYNPSIVHFTGPDKPWKIPRGLTAHPFAPDYFFYLSQTPYAGLCGEFDKIFNPVASFADYLKRHTFFFLRPHYYKMRILYRKNMARAASQKIKE